MPSSKQKNSSFCDVIFYQNGAIAITIRDENNRIRCKRGKITKEELTVLKRSLDSSKIIIWYVNNH